MGRIPIALFPCIAVILFTGYFSFAQNAHADVDMDDPVLDSTLRPDQVGTSSDTQEKESLSISYTDEELARIEATKEGFEYQAEVSRVMSILIDSLYSNKEVALRELISNGSDALDKVRLMSLTNPSVLDSNPNLEMRIWTDPESNTLTIQDTGVGMTREELVKNLGTIARSGTDNFAKAVAGGESSLIGMFGVGFYSAFLLADRVTVTSKSNDDDDQWIWESEAANGFAISKDPRGNTLGRGTRIDLHLKRDSKFAAQSKKFADVSEIENIIKEYSEFIQFPIYLYKMHKEMRERPLTEEELAELAEQEDEDIEYEDLDGDASDDDDQEDDSPKTKEEEVDVWEWELVNDTKPIWLRDKRELEDEDYHSFYKALSKDWQDPITYMHFKAEGDVTFKSILFVPEKPPQEQFANQKHDGIKLYVRRVFITDDFGNMFPRYLEFIKGVVDSDDLPLNVNRETLQQSDVMNRIKKKVVRKAIAMIQQMAVKQPEKYEEFYKAYSANIKLGVIDDMSNQARLAKLLRFHSSATGKETSLEDYVSRMQEGQEKIYYLGGENLDALRHSPLAENLRRNGIELLYLTKPIDEYALQSLRKFQSLYELVNVAKEDATEVEADDEAFAEEFEDLTAFMMSELPSKEVSSVKVTSRLYRSPCALVSSKWGYSGNMERIMKSQPLAPGQNGMFGMGGKVLEINPAHPIILELKGLVETDPEAQRAKDIAHVLYQTAAVASGFSLEDPTSFADKIHRLLGNSLAVNVDGFQEERELEDKQWVEPPQAEEEGEQSQQNEGEQPQVEVDEAELQDHHVDDEVEFQDHDEL